MLPAQSLTPSHIGRLFHRVSLASSLLIGGLQMFHVRAGWLTNYGADLFGTAWLYAIVRLGYAVFQRGRPANAATAATLIFVSCTVSELGQRVHLVPGHYEPLDIGAFALAIAVSLALERLIGPFVERQ